MKNIIYGAVIAILVLSSITILYLYYNQPFSEDLKITAQLNYAEIEVQKSMDYNQVEVLNFAKADIGSLNLKNDGYFTKVYKMPEIIGCIDINENIDPNSIIINQNQFSVSYQHDGGVYSGGQEAEIPVGQEKKFTLVAQYQAYNIPFIQFSNENIEGISLYRIDSKEQNPLGTNYDDYQYQYTNCPTLKSGSKPFATISIN